MVKQFANRTLVDVVAQTLYETCVEDHETYPYYLRHAAERAAFVKQAEAAIKAIDSFRARP